MERGSAASWEDLHLPLLELILERLPTPDYVRFAAVCSSWHHVQQNHSTASSSRHMRRPWLMFPVLSPEDRSRPFFDMCEERYYRPSICIPEKVKFICSSSHGWLLYMDLMVWDLVLVNPLTGYQIKITVPSSKTKTFFCNAHGQLSSVPTDPDCIVILWNHQCNSIRYFCRVRDKIWSSLSPPNAGLFLRNSVICKEKFYSLVGDSGQTKLFVADLATLPPTNKSFDMMPIPVPPDTLKFMVECDGHILLACLVWDQVLVRIKEFQIFKADLCRKVWMDVESLGDSLLFLDCYSAFSVSAAETSWPGNRIYCTKPIAGHLFIEYDFGTKELQSKLPCSPGEGLGFSIMDVLRWTVPSLR